MSKSGTIVHLKKENLVSVIRGSDKSEGLHCAIACIEGGISAIEIGISAAE